MCGQRGGVWESVDKWQDVNFHFGKYKKKSCAIKTFILGFWNSALSQMFVSVCWIYMIMLW